MAKTTTNLIKHQGVCPGLAAAVANKHPGLVPSNRDKYLKSQNNQLTISPSSGFLQAPWSDKTLKAKILRMISVESLPFSLVDSQSFKDLIQYCHEGASIPGRTTISNMIKSSYELVKTKVDHTVLAASKDTFIHYAHDSWTDSSCRNCYIGIYASWMNANFELQEILLRFMHLKGKHSAVRLANGLLSVFSTIGVANRLGPGTGDNASTNKAAAIHLAGRLEAEELYSMDGSHIIGCMCHILNLAAQDFLKNEGEQLCVKIDATSLKLKPCRTGTLSTDDYPESVDASVPSIRVVGVSSTRALVDGPAQMETDEGDFVELASDEGEHSEEEEPVTRTQSNMVRSNFWSNV